ncbi:MAG: hypothetical protein V1866_06030 [archaeon]
MNFDSKMEQEIETLARTLKNSKLAVSESEARRMAEEMLRTSKKVSDDFAERDKRLYSTQPKSKDVEMAQKALEQITSRMGKGESNVRIDVGELDLNKPLKDMIASEEEPSDREEDDAVDLGEPKAAPANEWTQPVAEPESVAPAALPKEIESDVDDDLNDDLDSEEEKDPADNNLEEKQSEEAEEAPAQAPAADGDSDEVGESGETDFSIKELSEAPKKSEEQRRKEIEEMKESKVDLSKMFDASK